MAKKGDRETCKRTCKNRICCRVSRKRLAFMVITGFGIYLCVSSFFAKVFLAAQTSEAERRYAEQLKANWMDVLPRNTEEDISIFSYLKEYDMLCGNLSNSVWSGGKDSEKSALPLCPCVSPFLVGRQIPNVTLLHGLSWSGVQGSVGELGPGGHWRPRLCRPRLRVAVVVPYRDREKDLRALLATLVPTLQRQLLEFRIFLVEQAWPALYNKGAMLDIGYLEAAKRWQFDCVLFQDVDLIQEDDRNIIHCLPNKPLHLGAYLHEQKYKLKYATIVGGALALAPSMFEQLNGYTTLYFGWGGEDDNMKGRINKKGLELARPGIVARYTHIKDLKRGDPSNPVDKYSRSVLGKKKYKIDLRTDGLSSVHYNVTTKAEGGLFTWINVVLDVKSLYTYANRPTFVYAYEPGTTCNGKTLSVIDVSFSTCKYMCDKRKDCQGFLLQRTPELQCSLKGICDTVKTESGSESLGHKEYERYYRRTRSIYELDEVGIRGQLPYHYPHPAQ